jgi:hypothetical protein
MSLQGWGETLISAQIDGTAVTLTSAGTILPTSAKAVLPANYFAIGKVLRLNAWGRISTINPTPGNLTLDFRLNNGVVFTSGLMPLNTLAAKTNVSWRAILMLTCRSVGSSSSGTLMGQGDFTSEAASGAAAGVANDIMMPVSVPAVGSGFDTTAAQVCDMQATFSITGNSIQLHQYTLESMN